MSVVTRKHSYDFTLLEMRNNLLEVLRVGERSGVKEINILLHYPGVVMDSLSRETPSLKYRMSIQNPIFHPSKVPVYAKSLNINSILSQKVSS